MSGELDKFIRDHREEFDAANPPAAVWQKIESGLDNGVHKKRMSGIFLRFAAAAAILFLVVTAVYLLSVRKEVSPGTTVTVRKDSVEPVPGELNGHTEISEFSRLVALKQEELKQLAPEKPELYSRFMKDINQLDSSYTALKNQLPVSPNPEAILQAMAQNLQLQLNVLNQQLSIIQQIRKSKNESNEKVKQVI
ncbi:MAG: hypothetical protein U0X40_10830 [Ferruginibacter sp.]